MLFVFKMCKHSELNKGKEIFQEKSRNLAYIIISPFTSQLRTSSRKVSVKYVGPVVVYQNIDSM